MKKILVTGVAGFVGWKTAEFLLKEGVEVIGIDNLNDYYDVKLKKHRLETLKIYKGFQFHKIDIEDLNTLKSIFEGNRFCAVINLAARAGVRYSMINPHVYFTTNVTGTLNLLELIRGYGIEKTVLASTSSLYAGQPMPFKEDLPVNTPISPYAASKKSAEVISYTYHYLYKLDISVIRYFTVYGPAGRPDMSIFRFIKWIDEGESIQLFGDGTQSRDFTYVDDIARGTIDAIKSVGYEIINLGGGKKPTSLNQVIQIIERYLGKKAIIDYEPFHKADLKETQADISKAKKLLRWEPEIDFDEGLKLTIDWYIRNREWLREVKV